VGFQRAEFVGLDTALDEALDPWRSDAEPLGVLFSGGVDSGLLAWELRERPNLRLVTAGMPRSPDLVAAEAGARRLGVPWGPIVLAPNDVTDAARGAIVDLEGSSPTSRSVLVALACAIAASPTHRLLCGQGADELFLGYAHFRGLSVSEAAERSRQDLDRLLADDWPRAQRIARRLGRSLGAPYLDPRFRDAAQRIPWERRLPGREAKSIFRDFAEHRGLPAELARRPKRAVQFGSGVDRILRAAPAEFGGPGSTGTRSRAVTDI
jgi:asparagine synthase (glutamine-hydrolysing)